MKWSLQNVKDRQVMNELTLPIVHAILSTIKTEELQFWLAKSAQSDWQPVSSFPELAKNSKPSPNNSFLEKPLSAEPSTKSQSSITNGSTDPFGDSGILSMPPRQRRKHPRIQEKFQVVLIVGNQTFRTHTADISLGGIRLANALPAHLANEYCNVFIYSPKAKSDGPSAIEFKAKIIADQGDPCRIEFHEGDERFKEKLQEWFDHVTSRGRRAA